MVGVLRGVASGVTSVNGLTGDVTISGGTPSGSDKQIQYNDGGAFGGAVGLYWDDVNGYFGIGSGASTPAYDLHFSETYTGTSGLSANFFDINISPSAGNDTPQWIGQDIDVDNIHERTGIIADATTGTIGNRYDLTVSGASSVDWQDGNEENIAQDINLTRSGAFTGTKHNVTNIGQDFFVRNNASFNNAGGTYNHSTYGQKLFVQSTGTVTAGTVTRNNYGQHITMQANTGGDTTNYGIYIQSISGADVNYSIYDTSGANVYIEGNIGVGSKTSPAYSIDSSGTIAADGGFRTFSETITRFSGTGLSVSANQLGLDFGELVALATVDKDNDLIALYDNSLSQYSKVSAATIADSMSLRDDQIEFSIEGTITTGAKKFIRAPMTGVITGWTIIADDACSIVFDVWKDTYANFPPLVGDSIAGSEKPTLSSANKNEDTTLSTWTTTITKGDILRFNVDSVTQGSASFVQVFLHVRRG